MSFNRLLLLLFSLLILVSCSTVRVIMKDNTEEAHSGPVKVDLLRSKVLDEAKSYIGTKYKYAGTTASGMDCSGLTYTVFKSIDVALPRTTSGQSQMGKKVAGKQIVAGDLVFFKKSGRIFHVGMISKVKSGQIWMIHSSSSKGVVEQEINSNSYWRPKLHHVKTLF
ncbi:MAG: C40 family peptidase [Bacteroidia bacterium]|nr:C40 family peptidase [Bacteroidia bacterium]